MNMEMMPQPPSSQSAEDPQREPTTQITWEKPHANIISEWRQQMGDTSPVQWKDHTTKQIGSAARFIIPIDGTLIEAEERFSFDGHSFILSVWLTPADGQEKELAMLRYQSFSGIINMGKTEIVELSAEAPNFRGRGINTRLFQDMSDLHPDAKEIWTTLDGDNSISYENNLIQQQTESTAKKMDLISAANNTPAGKIRIRAGWTLDTEKSTLPTWDPLDGRSGSIKLVYKRN